MDNQFNKGFIDNLAKDLKGVMDHAKNLVNSNLTKEVKDSMTKEQKDLIDLMNQPIDFNKKVDPSEVINSATEILRKYGN